MLRVNVESYIRNRRKLMIIPIIILLLSISYIAYKYITTGEIIRKDISLKGGTLVTVYCNKTINFENYNISKYDFEIREIRDSFGNLIGYELLTERELSEDDVNQIKKLFSGFEVTIGSQSASIGESFFRDMVKVLLFGFILMSLVSFYYFRNLKQSLTIFAVIIFDFIELIAFISFIDMKFSISLLGALLMIIDYSTDGNILISSYILKRKNLSLEERITKCFKIDFLCDIAAYITYMLMLLLSPLETIRQMAIILLAGTFFDQINNWLLTAPIQLLSEKK